MQELANMHALKKEKGIIPVSQVQPLILDSIKKKYDVLEQWDQFKSFKLALKSLRLCSFHT